MELSTMMRIMKMFHSVGTNKIATGHGAMWLPR